MLAATVAVLGTVPVVAAGADASATRPGGGQLVSVVDLGRGPDRFLDSELLDDGSVLLLGEADRRVTDSSHATRVVRALTLTRLLPDGSLDPTFGDGGSVVASALDAPTGWAKELVVTDDGGVIVVGSVDLSPGQAETWTARYDASGTIDASWGPAGIRRIHHDSSRQFRDVATRPGGGFAVVATQGRGDVLVDGYDAMGGPDPTFGPVRIGGSEYSGHVTAAATPSGAVFVATTTTGTTASEQRVFRITASGQLDASYGGGAGAAVLANQPRMNGMPMDLAVDGSGRAVLSTKNLVVRFTEGGVLDGGFGAAGIVTIGPEPATSVVGVDIDGPTTLVRLGMVDGVSRRLLRLDEAGRVMAGFGDGGLVTASPVEVGWTPSALHVRPDGRIVITGTTHFPATTPTPDADLTAVGLVADGQLDPTFGGGRSVVVGLGRSGVDLIHELVVRPDGSRCASASADAHLAVVCTDPAGRPLSSFDGDGIASFVDTKGDGQLATLPDGGLLVAGLRLRHELQYPEPTLWRLGPDGSIDESFGTNGRVAWPHDDEAGGFSVADLVVLDDGRIVLAGTRGGPDHRVFLRAIHADGTPDPTFGGTGEVATGFRPVGYLATDGDRVVLTGHDGTTSLGGSTHLVARAYTADGRPDPTFAGGGQVLVRRDTHFQRELVLDGEGRAYVLSSTSLDRLTADGRVDPTWAAASPGPQPGPDWFSYTGIALDQHDRPIVISWGPPGVTGQVTRLTDTGSPDPTFPGQGTLPLHLDRLSGSVTVDAIGDIVVAGDREFDGVTEDIVFVRVDPGDAGTPNHLGEPSSVSVEPGRQHVSVRWDRPAETGPEPIRGYAVIASRGGQAERWVVVAADARQVSLDRLTDGQTFEISVVALSSRGFGRASTPLAATPSSTASRTIRPPARLEEIGDRNGLTYAGLSWEPPADDGGSPIVAYSLVVTERFSGQVVGWRNVGPDVRTATVDQLPNDDGIDYRIYLVAWNAAGASDSYAFEADPFSNGSAPAAPAPPAWVTTGRDGATATVNWGPSPDEHGSAIVAYAVIVTVAGVPVRWTNTTADTRTTVLHDVPAGGDVVVLAANRHGFSSPTTAE